MSEEKKEFKAESKVDSVKVVKAMTLVAENLLQKLDESTLTEINSRLIGEEYETHTFNEVAEWYLIEHLDVRKAVESPLIQGLIESNELKRAKLASFHNIVYLIKSGEFSETDIDTFYGYIREYSYHLGGYFSILRNSMGVLSPLTAEERSERRGRGLRNWWKNNPVEALDKTRENAAKAREKYKVWPDEAIEVLLKLYVEEKQEMKVVKEVLFKRFGLELEDRDFTAKLSHLKGRKGYEIPDRKFWWDKELMTNQGSKSLEQIVLENFSTIAMGETENQRYENFLNLIAQYGLSEVSINKNQFIGKFNRLRKREL